MDTNEYISREVGTYVLPRFITLLNTPKSMSETNQHHDTISTNQKDESNDHDSQMIFDTTVPALFETIQESLHEIISTKLSTMPLFDKKDHKLVDDITKRYSQDMDAVEMYSKRYLFGIRKKLFTTKQRESILQEYLGRKLGSSSFSNASNTLPNSLISTASSLTSETSLPMPLSIQDIPSEEQFKTLDEEITSLRHELRKVKATSILYTSQLQYIQNLREHSTHVTNSIMTQELQSSSEQMNDKDCNNDNPEKVIDSVTAAMIGKEGLNDMTNKGKKLIQEMVFIQSQKDDKNETAEFSQWMKAKAKDLSEQNSERPKKKLTLEEDYDQRKDQLRVGMNGWKKNKSNE
jgi:hypothetical protein